MAFDLSGVQSFVSDLRGVVNEGARGVTELVAAKNIISAVNSKDSQALQVATATPFTPVYAAQAQAEQDAIRTGSILVGGKRVPAVVLIGVVVLGGVLAWKFIK